MSDVIDILTVVIKFLSWLSPILIAWLVWLHRKIRVMEKDILSVSHKHDLLKKDTESDERDLTGLEKKLNEKIDGLKESLSRVEESLDKIKDDNVLISKEHLEKSHKIERDFADRLTGLMSKVHEVELSLSEASDTYMTIRGFERVVNRLEGEISVIQGDIKRMVK